MKYNVLLSQSSFAADMHLKSDARWFFKEPSVYTKAACRLYRFLWPLFPLSSSISLSDFQPAVLCSYTTSIYRVSMFNRSL